MPSWMTETSLPSRFAPRATRCSVSGRWPFVKKSCLRGSHNFTGRFTSRAAKTPISTCGHDEPLLPNAPPTNGETTWTFSRGMPKARASVWREAKMFCVESWSVTRSPSQAATIACASIGLWWWYGVR
jgi:hypothetical protein